MNKNIEVIGGGLKCDNPNCDWKDLSVTRDQMKDFINHKCPKCGENVLTLEDYENANKAMQIADFINSLTPEQIQEMVGGITIEDLKEAMKDIPGVENLNEESGVVFSVDTHKEIKVTEIRNIDNENK